MNHSSIGKHSKVSDQIDMDNGEIKLYITTSVMLCGIDLPRVDIIVLTRPFSHMSSILQAAGKIYLYPSKVMILEVGASLDLVMLCLLLTE